MFSNDLDQLPATSRGIHVLELQPEGRLEGATQGCVCMHFHNTYDPVLLQQYLVFVIHTYIHTFCVPSSSPSLYI